MGNLKKQKRKIAAALLVGILLILYGVRVYFVNHNLPLPVVKEYKMNEIVPYEKDYFKDETQIVDGYTIQVLGRRVIDRKTFIKEYPQGEKDANDSELTALVLVKVKITNQDNKNQESSINISDTVIIGNHIVLGMNPGSMSYVNPGLHSAFVNLKPGESKELTLSYGRFKDLISYQELNETSWFLQITDYPHTKLIATQ